MDLILIIILVIIAALALGLSVWLFIIKFRHEEDVESLDVLINFMPNYSYPYASAVGIITNVDKINDRFLITYKPTDLDNKKVKEIKDIEPVKIAVDKNKLIPLPKNVLSPNRNIFIALAPSADNYGVEFSKSLLGKSLMKLTEDINSENTAVAILKNRNRVEDKLLKLTEGGDRMEQHIIIDKELNEELHKKILDKPSQKPTTAPYNSPQSNL